MEHGNGASDTPLHTLIPLADFKAILGVDDREDCLIPAAILGGVLPYYGNLHH
jgi:hypothetical protein